MEVGNMMQLRTMVVCATALVSVAEPALAALDAPVQQALALHSAGKPDEAFALLAPLERARAGDPDFDYAFGLAAVDSGQRGRAIVALQRVLALQPDNAKARAEIARAYALSGDIDTARAEFNTVVNDPSIPDPVRQRFDRLIRDYDRTIGGGGARATGFLDVEGGYDSNINAATNLTSITLPAFAFLGPASLGGGSSQTGAGFGQITGGLSGEVGLNRQTRAYASVLGLYRDSFKGSTFDQAALTGTAGIAYTAANSDVVSLSGQVQQFWLARASYRTSYGAIAQYTHALSGGRALSFAGQYTFLDYRTDPLRNADRIGGTISYAARTFVLSGGAGIEATRNLAGRHLGFGYAQTNIAAELPISKRAAFTASLGAEHRDYRGADPLFLAGRRDTQIDASIGARLVLTRAISVRPRATYTRNFSNLALYDYNRVTVSVSLRGEF